MFSVFCRFRRQKDDELRRHAGPQRPSGPPRESSALAPRAAQLRVVLTVKTNLQK
jgi:hypothetical protein